MTALFLGGGAGSPATSNSATVSATFTGGETVIVVFNSDATNTSSSCSDGTNTYTLVARNAGQTGCGGTAMYKADNVAAGTFTITGTLANTILGIAYFRYSGLAAGAAQTSNTAIYVGSGSSAADNMIGAAVTPTSQPALIVDVQQFNSFGQLVSPGTGFTARGRLLSGATTGGLCQDRRVTSTAAVTPTQSYNTSNFAGSNAISAVFSEVPASRPASDITTANWGRQGGGTYAGAVGESVADPNLIFSPDLAGSLSAATFGISPTLAAGTHNIHIQARRTATTGDVRALLLDSGGATVGTSAWQTLTAAMAVYTLAVTTTGTAARVSLEVRP